MERCYLIPNISLTASSISLAGSLEAFALNQGGSSFTSGTISLAGLNAAIIGGTGATLPNFNTGGASLAITANTSISLPVGSYINTRQTSWGNANDTTDNSTGNSGSISLHGPGITLGGQLNAYAGGNSYASGAISLSGLGSVSVGPTGTLPNFDTNGASLSIAASSVTVQSGGYINTRQTASTTANDTTSTSTGNSGNITLNSPTISLAGTLNAFATGAAYSSGTINLAGLGTVSIGPTGSLPGIDTHGASLDITASSITLQSGGYINTRQTGPTSLNDTTGNSTGPSGNITLDAPSITFGGTLNAYAIDVAPSAWPSGTITLTGMTNFTVGSGGNVASLSTGGASLVISTTTSILVDTTGTIDVRQTNAQPGNITLNAPTVTVKGVLDAYSASASYPSGTITLNVNSFDLDGTSQPEISTNGANLVIDASSINIESAGVINTRQLNSSGNSTGNSGGLTLNAPSLTLNGTLYLLANNANGTTYSNGGVSFSGFSDFTVGGSGSTIGSLDLSGIGVSINRRTASRSIPDMRSTRARLRPALSRHRSLSRKFRRYFALRADDRYRRIAAGRRQQRPHGRQHHAECVAERHPYRLSWQSQHDGFDHDRWDRERQRDRCRSRCDFRRQLRLRSFHSAVRGGLRRGRRDNAVQRLHRSQCGSRRGRWHSDDHTRFGRAGECQR